MLLTKSGSHRVLSEQSSWHSHALVFKPLCQMEIHWENCRRSHLNEDTVCRLSARLVSLLPFLFRYYFFFFLSVLVFFHYWFCLLCDIFACTNTLQSLSLTHSLIIGLCSRARSPLRMTNEEFGARERARKREYDGARDGMEISGEK